MAVTYTDLTRDNLPALQNFLTERWREEDAGPKRWPSDFAERFFRWRFLERKSWDTTLAMDGDRCIALMDSFMRDYFVAGRKMTLRENGVWWCHPDFRPLVAMRVMQMLMQKPEPVVIVGGSPTLQEVLKRYRWQPLGDVQHRVLVLGTGAFLKAAVRLMGSDMVRLPPAISRLASINYKRLPRFRSTADGYTVDVLRSPADLPAIEPPHDSYALTALADRGDAEWLMAAPEAEGRFIWLVFSEGGKPVGFSVSRLYDENGIRTAKLSHVQVARPDVDTYTWVIGETARHLASQKANWIDTMMSCPEANAAMDRIGFHGEARLSGLLVEQERAGTVGQAASDRAGRPAEPDALPGNPRLGSDAA